MDNWPRVFTIFICTALSEIFKGKKRDKRTRKTAIRNAVYEHGYSQKEVADFLGIYYSTISRALNKKEIAQNKTPY